MNLDWKDAISRVLNDENSALHYTEIAEAIAKKGYRTKLGATPQQTVNVYLNSDINQFGEESIFYRESRGYYRLRSKIEDNIIDETEISELQNIGTDLNFSKNLKIINSFGIYWKRDFVHWKPTQPELLGKQQTGATTVNFQEQIGVYLLHDARETIYVGQAIDQPISARLKAHISDRLNGRWDRFSWYGIYSVKDDGLLEKESKISEIDNRKIVDFLEAILIETIEPRQNRQSGKFFSGIEYLQVESKEGKTKKKNAYLLELMNENND